MTTVTITRTINAPASSVWGTLRTFGLDYFPGFRYTLEGEGEGATRTFKMPGGEMTEKVTAFDDEGMSLSYAIVSGPWPVKSYKATIKVTEADGGSTNVEWGAEFEPDGATEEEAVKIVEGTFKMNLKSLDKLLTAS